MFPISSDTINESKWSPKPSAHYKKDSSYECSNMKIRYSVMPNCYYDYKEEDVYKLLNKDVKRKTVIYVSVSANKQR